MLFTSLCLSDKRSYWLLCRFRFYISHEIIIITIKYPCYRVKLVLPTDVYLITDESVSRLLDASKAETVSCTCGFITLHVSGEVSYVKT